MCVCECITRLNTVLMNVDSTADLLFFSTSSGRVMHYKVHCTCTGQR